jgi:hypothetical protein
MKARERLRGKIDPVNLEFIEVSFIFFIAQKLLLQLCAHYNRILKKIKNKWLKENNEEHHHQGYRNRGKRPIDTVKKIIKIVCKEV